MSIDLSKEEIQRYSRHLMLPEVGMEGQRKLKAGKVLIIGAGGLGSPVAMYLAAAGVGTIGLVDFDTVDLTNLQRQILFASSDVGRPKLEAARDRLQGINPNVRVNLHPHRFSAETAMTIIEPYDLVIDGTDNFPTRYCTNDACVLLKKPNVYGSIFRFEGQATVFDPRPRNGSERDASGNSGGSGGKGPCYRCLYPEPPPPGMVPSCAEGGVLGILPGVIGVIQATEAVKLILGQGEPLTGRLLRFNALDMTFKTLKLRRDVNCPVCGDRPTISKLIDYEQFCGMRGEESTTIIFDKNQPIPAITVQELKRRLDSPGNGVTLIDVREPHEHAICSIKQATLIPLGQIPKRLNEFKPGVEYVVHCKMGGRSAQAVEMLRKNGINAVNVTGGITAWAREIDKTMPTY